MAAPLALDRGLLSAADAIAGALAWPGPLPEGRPWLGQSLSDGTAGTALLHIERARLGHGTWRQAHAWITSAARGEVSASDTTGLFLGLPAIGFMLDAAASGSSRYQAGLADADRHLAALACARAATGMARIRAGRPGGFQEWDVFFGLAGLGALLLRRAPGGSAMERVLHYLVALTRPLRVDGLEVPGWWAGHDPSRRQSPASRGGHGNFGAAHGIGPLALLGQAVSRGVAVDGQTDAITTMLAWLDEWKQDSPAGPWWPEWITLADLRAGRPGQRWPNRPSWCYGTPGIARAGQVAAIALGDHRARCEYEQALLLCLRDRSQVAQLTDAGLCHGAAGLYMTAWRAAQDALTPAIGSELPGVATLLLDLAAAEPSGPGFLNGTAGTALALHVAASDTAPASGWDACLLIS
jgi:lantibiotic biosynthesis protein